MTVPTASVHRLNPNHEQILARSGITREQAEKWGVWSCSTPDGLAGTDLDHDGNRGKTGLVFPLRRSDGSVTYQMRVDDHLVDEAKGVRKYAQAAGVGAIINVPEMMAPRVGKVSKVFVVEGTKQTIAASLYAPEDVLVFGIQGARNWSKDGIPLSVLCELVPQGSEVWLGFDADWQTNPDVWAAAKYLKGHLEDGAGAGSVKVVVMSSGGKTGLDDFLGSNPDPTSRPAMLARLMDKATTSLGRKPAARKQSAAVKVDEALTVDLEAGRIMKVVKGTDGFGNEVTRSEVALYAAAEIIASEAHVDEETGETADQMLTLRVHVPISGQDSPSKFVVKKVKSSKLADIGGWLDRLPRGIGVPIPRSTKPDDDIANSIRANSTAIESVTVVSHTGWTFDPETELWRWCDGVGAIGAEDKVAFLRGEPASSDFRAIDLPKPATTAAEKAKTRDAISALIWSRDHFNDDKKFNWDVAVAAWGLAFLGITPLASLCYFGPPASGKSTIAQTIASSLNKLWAPNGAAMSTFNARPAGMDLLPDGLRHAFLHVDDLKPEADSRKMTDALAAFDALLRRAHGSGGAVRGTVDKAADRLGVRKVDAASPMMIITGEEIPTGEGFAESGLDRALFIQVLPRTQLKDEKALSALTRMASSGLLRHATTAYLQWIAAQINTADVDGVGEIPAERRLDAWKAHLDAQRQSINSNDEHADDLSLKKRLPAEFKVSDRARMLVASLVLGYENVLAFACEAGVVTDEQAGELWDHFVDGIVEAIKTHTREVMGGNATPSERALTALRNAVSSREVTLNPDEPGNKPLIGEVRASSHPQRVMEVEGTAVIINHAAAAKALRWSGGARALQSALADVAVATSTGQTTRTLTINRARVQCMVISEDVWGPVDEPTASSF
ncbi:hypothetical protein CHO01_28900 [Cellulomonas hominis]|uniref:DUF3854 domain-containing protein n=1 Tax=Cellulomonas hominis TaxID=156981 RepID=A0A511FGR7_9CELL|nr:hypothetical protein [Cellulomonas hominis]MBB5474759.1 hypothetical protein [Cellulomonas hominis]NKY05415.1 hypothetical protein [Cellulomonas hominis]GEL47774.1 hypothetical protein CHO01_28900 [Cellulomonas hominis]